MTAFETSRVRGRARTLLEWAGRSETAYSGLAEDVSRDLIDALDEIERLREALHKAPSPLYISTAGQEEGLASYSAWYSGARVAALGSSYTPGGES